MAPPGMSLRVAVHWSMHVCIPSPQTKWAYFNHAGSFREFSNLVTFHKCSHFSQMPGQQANGVICKSSKAAAAKADTRDEEEAQLGGKSSRKVKRASASTSQLFGCPITTPPPDAS